MLLVDWPNRAVRNLHDKTEEGLLAFGIVDFVCEISGCAGIVQDCTC
jgi:hypothetical protein